MFSLPRLSLRVVAAGSLLLMPLTGCPSSTSSDEDAGTIRFDASAIPDATTDSDAGVDAGPPASDIGAGCASDAECSDICIDEFPGGYCSQTCTGDCPEGSQCTPVGRGLALCLQDCDPAAEDPCERPGYGCSSRSFVCVPGCTEDSDCGGELACDRLGGFGGAGSCYDPGSETGAACTSDAQCPAGGFCLAEDLAGWPGGTCIGFDCDVATNEGCGEGAHCIEGRRDPLCIAACSIDDDCRDGYRCVGDDDYPERRTCRPACTSSDQCAGSLVCNPAVGTCDVPFDTNELGRSCSTRRGACAGGTCLTEFDSGHPGSECVFEGCTPGPDAADGCPGDGVCLGDADPYCISACTSSDDCRSGYACLPVDAASPERGMGCRPACTDSDQCANDGTDGAPRFECNPGTGRCGFPTEPTSVGMACASDDECGEGRCLSETETGLPGGLCIADCEVGGDECPAATTCRDNPNGDGTVCLPDCVPGSDTCRSGYACDPALYTCVAQCAEGDCSDGLSCDATTGFCAP